MLSATVATVAPSHSAFAATTPLISTQGTSGMAPFTVHAHALNSTLNAGDRATALYQWDFGDPAGRYNTITGWNAAHVYDTPGTYTITLKITTEDGVVATRTQSVSVSSDTRTKIYVSPSGNDSNSGTSSGAPVRTIGRAWQLLNDNVAIYFQRGGTYSLSGGVSIWKQNVVVGAYGSGNRPIWSFTNSSPYLCILAMGDSARNITIQDLEFDTPFAASNQIAAAVGPAGVANTVRGCKFSDVSDAINLNRVPVGVLAMDNTTGTLGGYFMWAQGTDVSVLGNTVGGSANEHNIRLGGANRVLIAGNNLTNTVKSSIWCMLGSDAYLSGNTIHDGRLILGPNFASGAASERFTWYVSENNQIYGDGFELYHGADTATIRNNYMEIEGDTAITVWGYSASMNRSANNIKVLNNTYKNSNSTVRFMDVGQGASNVVVANNLVVAPAMVTWYSGSGNMWVQDSGLASFTNITRNVWAIPASTPDIPGARHYVWPYWSNASGYRTESQWEAFSQVVSDGYENVSLNSQRLPGSTTMAATFGRRIAGVQTDMWGKLRPAGNIWSAGAAEVNPQSGGGNPPPPPPPPPPPGSGTVIYNMQDGTGWVVSNSGAITDGAWERGVPAGDGTRGDPRFDADGSGACYLTGNRPGNSDVDGGTTVLTSPTVNVSGTGTLRIRAKVWMYSQQVNNDLLYIDVSNNNGASWVPMGSQGNTNGAWVLRDFTVSDYVSPSSQMKVRFTVTDGNNDSILEAGVDAVEFCYNCGGAITGDVNGDGQVNIEDLTLVVTNWGICMTFPGSCTGDVNGDGRINVDDYTLVVINWTS